MGALASGPNGSSQALAPIDHMHQQCRSAPFIRFQLPSPHLIGNAFQHILQNLQQPTHEVSTCTEL